MSFSGRRSGRHRDICCRGHPCPQHLCGSHCEGSQLWEENRGQHIYIKKPVMSYNLSLCPTSNYGHVSNSTEKDGAVGKTTAQVQTAKGVWHHKGEDHSARCPWVWGWHVWYPSGRTQAQCATTQEFAIILATFENMILFVSYNCIYCNVMYFISVERDS